MKEVVQREKPIKYLLIGFFLLLSVTIIGGGTFYYRAEEKAVKNNHLANLKSISRLKIDQIVSWRRESFNDLKATAEGPLFRITLEEWIKTGKKEDKNKELLISRLNVARTNYQYESIAVLDKGGKIILAVDQHKFKMCDRTHQLFQKTLQTGNLIFGDFYQCPGFRKIMLDLMAPISTRVKDAQVMGVLVLRIDPQVFLYPLIQTWPLVSDTSETLLVRREGNEILFLNELRHKKNTALTLHFPISTKQLPAAMAVSGIEDIVDGIDYRGHPVVAITSKIPDSPWYLIAKTDTAEVYLPLYDHAYMLLIIVGGSIVLLAVGMGYFWRQHQAEFYRKQYEMELKRKLTEEKMKILSSRQQALLAAIPDIIMEVDANKIYTWANEPGIEFFGKDVISKPADFYFVREQETYDIVQPIFNGSEDVIYVESWQRRKDGQERLLAWWCRVLKDEQGNVTGALSSARDITDHKLAEEEIKRLNRELEQRVIERTTQLEAVNKELESFAYSVSHDLRAPLRSVDGFSHALLEDYQGKLDTTGKSYLERIRKATQHMGNLIDDMLKLSRVIQSEFNYESIDLSKMVRTIADAFQKNNPDKTRKVTIQKGLIIQGDSHSMQIALMNLIDNAWKFTGKQKHARIEFGTTLQEGKMVFFVRDNGVGFDMAYVGKLFGAFQRLHTMDEFAGTGIGLATVQRIIHRHGGKIWAEGEVGKGATFYFTLPE